MCTEKCVRFMHKHIKTLACWVGLCAEMSQEIVCESCTMTTKITVARSSSHECSFHILNNSFISFKGISPFDLERIKERD
jgi:hypothetical protein